MIKIVLIAIIMLMTASGLFAQSTERLIIYVSNGISVPSSPTMFKKIWNPGYNLSGGVGFPFIPNFILQCYFDYNHFGLEHEELFWSSGSSEYYLKLSNTKILTASANFVVFLQPNGSKLAPYLTEGLGFSRVSTTKITGNYPIEKHSEMPIALFFGGGFEMESTRKLNIFFEFKYAIYFTSEENTQFFTIKLGLIYRKAKK